MDFLQLYCEAVLLYTSTTYTGDVSPKTCSKLNTFWPLHGMYVSLIENDRKLIDCQKLYYVQYQCRFQNQKCPFCMQRVLVSKSALMLNIVQGLTGLIIRLTDCIWKTKLIFPYCLNSCSLACMSWKGFLYFLTLTFSLLSLVNKCFKPCKTWVSKIKSDKSTVLWVTIKARCT